MNQPNQAANTTENTTAEIIFFGGDIVTVDENQLEAEALAVQGGKIVAVGRLDEVLRWQTAVTEMVDLQGQTLMPGLIEPHTHPIGSALLYNWVDVSGMTHSSAAEVFQQLREAAAKAKLGEWIFGFGIDPILVRDLPQIDADLLDEISKTNPIFLLLQSMHTAFVNHKAFEVMGITDDTPQPGGGGHYVKDENGQLTGMLVEAAAMFPFMAHGAAYSPEECAALVQQQFARYARVGVTTIGVTGILRLLPNADELLREQIRSDQSPIRGAYFHANHFYPEEAQERLSGDDRFRYLGTKYWIDGSPYTGTMLLDEPYLNSDLMQNRLGIAKDSVGQYMIPKGEMQAHIERDHAANVQISIHAQGDRAVRDTLDIYEAALTASPRADHRFRLEHVALGLPEDIERAARLGATISFHINHLYYYGCALRDEIIGPERAQRSFPIGTAVSHGHRISLHADSPMYPANPLLLMKTAVTRQTREGDVIGPDEAISIDDAIKGVTIDAAWQLFMEDKVGSLEVGKLADLAILSHNPRRVDPGDLDKIKVKVTYLAGRRVEVG